MTVCVAAICRDDWIVGAADKMLSSNEGKFHPDDTKIVRLLDSIVMLWAGDTSLQGELLDTLRVRIATMVEKEWSVHDLAMEYMSALDWARRVRAELCALTPLGLNYSAFIANQKQLNDKFVDDVTYELKKPLAVTVQALFVGRDATGSHIYYAGSDGIGCRDLQGFGVIGSGCNHATIQLSFLDFKKSMTLEEATFAVYSAKKHAEVAPTVGTATDMFVFSPNYLSLNSGSLTAIDEEYRAAESHAAEARQMAITRLAKLPNLKGETLQPE